MSLKYFSNFWRTPEMRLINCEIIVNLTWCKKCVVSFAVGKTEFAITDTKLYVPAVTLSTEDNVKLLKWSESDFIRTVNCVDLSKNFFDPVDAGPSLLKKIKKYISSIKGSGTALTKNEKADIMKVIKSLENRGILSKGTTGKINSQKAECWIFLDH